MLMRSKLMVLGACTALTVAVAAPVVAHCLTAEFDATRLDQRVANVPMMSLRRRFARRRARHVDPADVC